MKMTIISANMSEDKNACSIHVWCAHTEVRLCIVQLSCVCLWTNGKKTNKEGTMSMYNVYVMYNLSHV